MKKPGFWMVAAMIAAGAAVPAQAQKVGKVYQLSGKVAEIRNDTISIEKGDGGTLEFRRDELEGASRALQGVKPGDEVTIWYELDARKIRAKSKPSQEPGQAAPTSAPGEKKQIIIDDRAFYDARNDEEHAPRKTPRG